MSDSAYSVYLIERHGEEGGKREVTSPVRGNELDFYDSGVWLERETGRSFFPYEQIRTIREHPEGRGPEHESEPITESGSDEADPGAEGGPEAEGDSGIEDEPGTESDPETEGDPGAEEELLE